MKLYITVIENKLIACHESLYEARRVWTESSIESIDIIEAEADIDLTTRKNYSTIGNEKYLEFKKELRESRNRGAE